MREFLRPDSFDLIVNMFTSFGYFENKEDDLLVLQNMYTNLKSGGNILIDIIAKEILAKIFQPTTSQTQPDGSRLFQQHEVIDGWNRMQNEWIYIQDETIKTFNFSHTLYSGQELKVLLEQAGDAARRKPIGIQ